MDAHRAEKRSYDIEENQPGQNEGKRCTSNSGTKQETNLERSEPEQARQAMCRDSGK